MGPVSTGLPAGQLHLEKPVLPVQASKAHSSHHAVRQRQRGGHDRLQKCCKRQATAFAGAPYQAYLAMDSVAPQQLHMADGVEF